MSNSGFRHLFFVVLLLFAGSPALAAKPNPIAVVRPVSSAVVLADFGGFGNVFSSGGRTRIIQICVAAMCLALFIMMRKLSR